MSARFEPLSFPTRRHLFSITAPGLLGLAFLAASPAQAQALDGGQPRVLGVPNDALCSGGLIYDDGNFEDALGGGGGDPREQQIVEYVTPASLPSRFTQVCVAFSRAEETSVSSMDFSIVLFAPDGESNGNGFASWPDMWPGTPLAVIPAHVEDIPVYPAYQFYAVDTSQAPVLNGNVLLGVKWNPSTNGPSPKVRASIDTTAATIMPIFNVTDTGSERWQALTTDLFSANYVHAMSFRALQAGADSVPPARPSATPSFSPPVVAHGTPSTLMLTLANRNASAATLTSSFANALPAGLAVAAPPNAATTCANGSVDATASGSSVTLAAGASIPAAGSCTVSVSVIPAAGGTYVDAVASGDLQTDQGANTALPAEAKLIVSTGGGAGGSVNENFDEAAAPELPVGWTSPVDAGLSIWTTVAAADSDTTPNAAHAPDAPRTSDFSLVSPAFTVSARSVLSFRQKYEFDNDIGSPPTCYDGGVLEISTDGGNQFSDIVEAGGVFQAGGYGCTIDSPTNPLSGRPVWGGTTGSQPYGGTLNWIDVRVALGTFAGQSVILRWREGADGYNTWYSASGDWPGWWIDSIEVRDAAVGDSIFKDGFEAPPPQPPTLSKAFASSSVAVNTPTRLTITLANANAAAITLTGNLVDAFPAGMVSAANATTTCSGGAGILQTGSSVTLQAGATIPAAGSCAIDVDVAATAAGDLVNTIPAGGLVTDAGSNAASARATLTVTSP